MLCPYLFPYNSDKIIEGGKVDNEQYNYKFKSKQLIQKS